MWGERNSTEHNSIRDLEANVCGLLERYNPGASLKHFLINGIYLNQGGGHGMFAGDIWSTGLLHNCRYSWKQWELLFQGCEQSKRRFLPHVHWPTFFIYDIGKSSFSSLSTCWQAQHFSPRTCRFLKELRSWTYWSTDGTPADGLKLLSLSTQNFAGSFNSHQIGFKLHMYRRHWITTICLILTYWKLSNCIWSSYG